MMKYFIQCSCSATVVKLQHFSSHAYVANGEVHSLNCLMTTYSKI